MIDESHPPMLNFLVTHEARFSHDGIYYHRLYLHDGETVTSSSPMSAKVAEWNAKIRLQMLVDNGRI